MTTPFTVRSPREEDWEHVKALRLEMLADTPLAYLETLEQARAKPDDLWRRRAGEGVTDRGITAVAILPSGRWVGSMTVRVLDEDEDPWLLAVYVAADVRGDEFGVTDALLAEMERWARSRASGLLLEVNEANARARAAYRKRGFVETGRRRPYPLDPTLLELEMRKSL